MVVGGEGEEGGGEVEERRRRRRVEGREEEKSAGEKRSKRKIRPRGARRHDRVEKGAVVKDIEEDSKLTSAVKPDDPGRAETSKDTCETKGCCRQKQYPYGCAWDRCCKQCHDDDPNSHTPECNEREAERMDHVYLQFV